MYIEMKKEEENRFMRYDFKSKITKLTFRFSMKAYSQLCTLTLTIVLEQQQQQLDGFLKKKKTRNAT